MKKKIDKKTATFGLWGQKTSFWQFGPKGAFKPQVQNPGFNFKQRRLRFIQNHMFSPTKLSNLKESFNLDVRARTTSFWKFGLKILLKSQSFRTLAPIFTRKILFYPKLYKWNLTKSRNFKNYVKLRVWDQKTRFELLGSNTLNKP